MSYDENDRAFVSSLAQRVASLQYVTIRLIAMQASMAKDPQDLLNELSRRLKLDVDATIEAGGPDQAGMGEIYDEIRHFCDFLVDGARETLPDYTRRVR
jgi:hypothetical protein